jgi:hypothetical protein
VVKLNDDRGLFSFDLIEINNNKTSFSNLHVDDFKKVKEISKADFLKSRKFYFENK